MEMIDMDEQNNGYHVLVVDDEYCVRDILSYAIEEAGFHVITAENGLDALSKYDAKNTKLVFSDGMMPQMDGLELYKNLKKINPNIEFYLVTGMFENAKVQELNQNGVKIISKPFIAGDLVNIVRSSFEKQP